MMAAESAPLLIGTEDLPSAIFQAVERVRMERCPAQAVLPLVGLAVDKIPRDRY